MHLIDTKGATFLSQVKMEDNKQGGMHQHFGVGEDPTTPRRQALAREPQLVEKNLARLYVKGGVIPSFKSRHPKPKNLKVQGFQGPRSSARKGGNGPTRWRREH
jgi:hypothetical protein